MTWPMRHVTVSRSLFIDYPQLPRQYIGRLHEGNLPTGRRMGNLCPRIRKGRGRLWEHSPYPSPHG